MADVVKPAVKHVNRTEYLEKIIADVRPHILALSVTDDDPLYKSLLARIDEALKERA